MTKIKCSNCKNAIEPLVEKRGLGKNNVEYIKTMECKLGFKIGKSEMPDPRCNGKYFEPK